MLRCLQICELQQIQNIYVTLYFRLWWWHWPTSCPSIGRLRMSRVCRLSHGRSSAVASEHGDTSTYTNPSWHHCPGQHRLRLPSCHWQPAAWCGWVELLLLKTFVFGLLFPGYLVFALGAALSWDRLW